MAMAEYAASTSCFKLNSIPNPQFRAPKSKCSFGRCKLVQFSPKNTSGIGVLYLRRPYIKEASLKCSCLGSLVDPDGLMASDIVASTDQLLLMATIALTYVAGVIPVKRSNLTSFSNILNDSMVRESATATASSGSAKNYDEHVGSKNAWDAVKAKILGSLDTIENTNNPGSTILEIEQQQYKLPLSLSAVSEGPKLRLLWASFKQLEDEVNRILGNCEALNLDDWLNIFPETIKKSSNRICKAWILEELHLENKEKDEVIVSLMSQKLKGDDTVLQCIKKSGKEDLYAELLYFLRFGFLRKSCYDQSLFSLHGDSVLEDLVINLADGIATVYLELISVDGTLSSEMNDMGVIMCNLSTRALQRLRNEVSLNKWLYQNVEAIVSMYEDRFDLCTLQSKIIEESSQSQTANSSWWKKLALRQSGTLSSSRSYAVICQFSLPVKRTKELRALTGWRYYFSLYLELSDIAMPLIRAVIEKISNAISFFLVSLIGRSLGLIYTGIRQSLKWK